MEEENRTIKLLANSVEITQYVGKVGHTEFARAFAYLSTWNMSFPKVVIYLDLKDFEMQASYRDLDDKPQYFICGVWDGVSFSFHS
jgi:hypothetical protein